MFKFLQLTYFIAFFFLNLALCQLQRLSELQKSPVPLHTPLPDVIIATDATSTHWTYFQGSGLPLCMMIPCVDLCAGYLLSLRGLKQLHLCCVDWIF